MKNKELTAKQMIQEIVEYRLHHMTNWEFVTLAEQRLTSDLHNHTKQELEGLYKGLLLELPRWH